LGMEFSLWKLRIPRWLSFGSKFKQQTLSKMHLFYLWKGQVKNASINWGHILKIRTFSNSYGHLKSWGSNYQSDSRSFKWWFERVKSPLVKEFGTLLKN
jgi:hypothetical protein